jgi:hypothetical protein
MVVFAHRQRLVGGVTTSFNLLSSFFTKADGLPDFSRL